MKENLKFTDVCYANSPTLCEMSVVKRSLQLVSLPVAVETQPMCGPLLLFTPPS